MNPFYRRLLTFGHMVQHLSRVNKTNYKDYFEVEHPGFPVFHQPALVRPRLSFKKPCPKKDRHQITELFNMCFGSHELVH